MSSAVLELNTDTILFQKNPSDFFDFFFFAIISFAFLFLLFDDVISMVHHGTYMKNDQLRLYFYICH